MSTIKKAVIRTYYKEQSKIDPNKIFAKGQNIRAYTVDGGGNIVLSSHKLGDAVTKYSDLTELLIDPSLFLQLGGDPQTVTKTVTFSSSPQVPDGSNDQDAVNYAQLLEVLPSRVLGGLDLSLSDLDLTVGPGSWRIHGIKNITTVDTHLTIDAQDATLSRYDTVYADMDGNLGIESGTLSNTPFPPSLTTYQLTVANILITPASISFEYPSLQEYVTTNTAQTIDSSKIFNYPQTFNGLTYFNGGVNLDDSGSGQSIFNAHYVLSDYSGGGVAGLFNYISVTDPSTNYLFGFDASANQLIYGDAAGRRRILTTADLTGLPTGGFNNGLSLDSSTSTIGQLGGSLIQETTLNLNGNHLIIAGVAAPDFDGNGATYFKYDGNYSDAFDSEDRTIPDSGWVRNLITNSVGNGLRFDSGQIKLGGSLTEGTSINTGTFGLVISGGGSSGGVQIANQYTVGVTGSSAANGGLFMNTGLTWLGSYGTGGSSVPQRFLSDYNNGLIIEDQIKSRGVIYAADYSANFTSRSLIDKGYADAHYSSGVITPTSVNGLTLKRDHVIYTMGDSFTAAGTYQTQLSTSLAGAFKIINLGISGGLASGMNARFSEVTGGSGEYVIILGGINDIIQGQTASQIETSLQAMYTAAHNAGLKVIAMNIPPFGANVNWTSGLETIRTTVNTWIASTAINIDYKIDIATALWDPANHTNLNPTYDSGDGLHPNTAGYNLIGTTIFGGATFTPSVSTPTLEFAGNFYVDQNLGTFASPTFKSLNLNTLYVTGQNLTSGQASSNFSSGADGTMAAIFQSSLATQTADILQVQDNAANVSASFALTGQALKLTPLADATKGLLIKEFSGTYSANPIEVQNNSGTVLWRITSAGLTATTGIFNPTSANNGQILMNAPGIAAQVNTATSTDAFSINQQNSSATGNILSLKFAGTAKAQFGTDGRLGLGIASPLAGLDVHTAITATSGEADGMRTTGSLTPDVNNSILSSFTALGTYQTGASAISASNVITGGSGGTNGTYNAVALTGGTGSGATANITVSGNTVTAVTMVQGGTGYTAGDVISASSASIGNVTGFSFTATVGLTGVVRLNAYFKNAAVGFASISTPSNFISGSAMMWYTSPDLFVRDGSTSYNITHPVTQTVGDASTNPANTNFVYQNATGAEPNYFYPGSLFKQTRISLELGSYLTATAAGNSLAPVHIAFIGDSRLGIAPNYILDAVAQYGKLNSLGFIAPYSNIYGSSVTWSQSGASPVRNDATSAQTWGIAGSRIDLATGNTWSVQPSSKFPFDKVRIFYNKTVGGGTFSYTIDGGAPTNVNTDPGSGGDTLGILTISTGLANQSSHTILLTGVSGSSRIYGMDFQNQVQDGYIVDILQSGGSKAQNWATTGAMAYTTQYLSTNATYGTSPAAVTIWLDLNDATSSRTSTQYIADIRTIISNLALPTTSSPLLVTYMPQMTTNTSGIEDATVSGFLSAYRTEILKGVQTDGWAAIDAYKADPSVATMYANGYYTDNQHFTATYATHRWSIIVRSLFSGYFNQYNATGNYANYIRRSTLIAPNGVAGFGVATESSGGALSETNTGWYGIISNTTNCLNYKIAGTEYIRMGSDGSTNTMFMTFYPTSTFTTILQTQRLNTPATRAWSIGIDVGNDLVFSTNNSLTSFSSNSFVFGTGNANTLAAGTYNHIGAYPNVNQSGSAGYTGMRLSAFEQATGSGNKYLFDIGTNTAANNGGTHSSKFLVTNAGLWGLGGTLGTANQVPIVNSGGTAMAWGSVKAADTVNTATDANYTVTSSTQLVKLPVITANRTVSIPTASSYTGLVLIIWNQNTSGTFSWSFTGATVKDAANNSLSTLVNSSVYLLESDGTNWLKIN